jgi:glutaredoxin
MKKVTVYGADWCESCHVLRDYLDSLGVVYEYKDTDLSANEEEMLEKLGVEDTTIPVVEIDGEMIVGSENPRIKELLS